MSFFSKNVNFQEVRTINNLTFYNQNDFFHLLTELFSIETKNKNRIAAVTACSFKCLFICYGFMANQPL